MPFLSLLALASVRRRVNVQRPDAIIVHNYRLLPVVRRAAAGRCPIIAVNHGGTHKAVANSLDAVIALTEAIKHRCVAKGFPEERVFVINNAVDIADMAESLGGRRNPPVVGMLGRLEPEKNFDAMLKACAMVTAKGYPLQIAIGGSGYQRAALESEAARLGLADRTTFLGWIDDRKTFFSGIDVFCSPARNEPFGLVILEAMKYGVPILAVNSGGPREILEDGVTGSLVEPDPAALATGLEGLLEAPDAAAERALTALDVVGQHYTPAIFAGRIDEAVRHVIDRWRSENNQ